jgi:hypothetical protein
MAHPSTTGARAMNTALAAFTTLVTRTPPWVWLLLAALIALGLLQARDRVVRTSQVLALPAGLGLWSLVSTGMAFGWQAGGLAAWALAWGLGLALRGWPMPDQRVQALADGRWAVAGSWAPLALMLAIFAIRYGVSASLALRPGLAALPAFAAAAGLLYGLPSGLLAARAWQVLRVGRSASGQPHWVGHSA